MKVKIFTMSALFALSTMAVSAQQFKIGVEAGYDNVKFKDNYEWSGTYDGEKESYSEEYKASLNGFHIGPTFNYDFTDDGGLGLKFGLFWQHASGKNLLNFEDKKDYDEYKKEQEEYCGKWKGQSQVTSAKISNSFKELNFRRRKV